MMECTRAVAVPLTVRIRTLGTKIESALDVFDQIALNKGRVKWTALFHTLVFLLLIGRLSKSIMILCKLDVPSVIERLSLPAPQPWELCWLASIMASVFAYLSLKRNNSSLLWQALIGQVLLGLIPVCYGLYSQYPDLKKYIDQENKDRPAFPYPVLSLAWLAVSLQVHLFQIYFSQQLLSAWASAVSRKAK